MNQREHREQTVRDLKSNLILDAAREIFSMRGFHETRLEDIASQAGFSKASLYNYYPDKESIFFSLAHRDLGRLISSLQAALNPNRHVKENLEAMIRCLFDTFGEHFTFLLTISFIPGIFHIARDGELNNGKCELHSQINDDLRQVMGAFAQAIAVGKANGEIDCELDDLVTARYITGMIRGVIFKWRIDQRMGDVSEEASSMVQFIAHGICPKGR